MPLFIVRTHSTNEYYNADCDWMLIEMTPAYAQRILTVMDTIVTLKQTLHDSVSQITLTYAPVECFKYHAFDDHYDVDDANPDGYTILPLTEDDLKDIEPEQLEFSTDVIVSHDWCEWTCAPKHSEITISSAHNMDRKDLEAWAKGEFDDRRRND